jgi:capsular polysaccharide biosynthesis protein
MRVTVTCHDPYEAQIIAKGIETVLPERVAQVIEGATMEVVDTAYVDTEKVGPSITLYTTVGFAVGMLLSVAVLIALALMDNTVHDEDYVIRTFGYPILAQVPNLNDTSSKRYGYYASGRDTKHTDTKWT